MSNENITGDFEYTEETVIEGTIIPTGTPTQLAHPAKATLRTALTLALGALVAIVGFGPLVIDAIVVEPIVTEGIRGPLLAVSGILVAVGSIVSRIMQIPGIQPFLVKIGFGTGVERE